MTAATTTGITKIRDRFGIVTLPSMPTAIKVANAVIRSVAKCIGAATGAVNSCAAGDGSVFVSGVISPGDSSFSER